MRGKGTKFFSLSQTVRIYGTIIRYGIDIANSKFLPKYKEEKGHVKKGQPDIANVISGKLMYLKMVKGNDDPVYLRLSAKFQKLTGEVPVQEARVEATPLDTLMEKLNEDLDILLKDT